MDELSFLKKRATEKAQACEAIEEVLLIFQERREPDDWERACLESGIGALFRGAYVQACVFAAKALTPLHERTVVARPSEFDSLDLKALARAFSAAQAERLKSFPHLGPIVFAEDLKPA